MTSASKLNTEVIEGKVEAKNNELKIIRQSLKEANDAITAISRDKDLLVRKLIKIDPEEMSFANKIGNIVLDCSSVDLQLIQQTYYVYDI